MTTDEALESLAVRRVEGLIERLETGAVGLHGDPGVGVSHTLATAARRLRRVDDVVVLISLRENPTLSLLLPKVLDAVESTVRETGPGRRELALMHTGVKQARQLAATDPAAALSSLRASLTLVLDDVRPNKETTSLLWALRSVLQHRPDWRLAIGANSAAVERLAAGDAPLYALVTWLRLERLTPDQTGSADVETIRLVEASAGLPGHLIAADRLRQVTGDSRGAWDLLVRTSAARRDEALAWAGEVHLLGPPLLVAIARGQRPYTAVPGARSVVASALRALRRSGLLIQPRAREWAVADPVIAELLRRP